MVTSLDSGSFSISDASPESSLGSLFGTLTKHRKHKKNSCTVSLKWDTTLFAEGDDILTNHLSATVE